MKRKRRIGTVLLVLLPVLIITLNATGLFAGGAASIQDAGKTTLRLWYSDTALTDYLNAKCVQFNESHTDLRAEATYVPAVELLETISNASLNEEIYPDLYLATNDILEKAQLAGLAADIPSSDPVLNAARFPQTALNAVTYHGRYIAYPFYFETSTLMYNRTFLEDLSRDAMENEIIEMYPDAKAGDPVLQVADEDVEARVQTLIPATIADILTFARTFILPDTVEAVFKWDVTDIFYNYFFVGAYMDTGGDAGDNIAKLDLYNAESVSCMKAYQKLNTYFAIDAADVDYDSIVTDFIEGKMVFTVVTSDAVTKIREAQANGSCPYTYGASATPSLNEYYGTRTMSVTECIVVNGYSEHPEQAREFARMLAGETDETMFRQTGKLPAKSGIIYEDELLNVFTKVYEQSVPMPKMIETSNMWMLMEIAFTQIWNGADCNQTLKTMSENMMKQVVGGHYEEMLLPEPDMVSITDGANDD